MTRAEVAGAEISANRSRYRVMSEGYCPRCAKLIAAVVVYREAHWLWLAGGRVGSHSAMLEEFERLRDDAVHSIAQARRNRADLVPEFEEALTEVDRMIRTIGAEHMPAVAPPMAWRTDYLLRFGDHTGVAGCRGCRRDMGYTLAGDLSLRVSPLGSS